MCCGNEQSLSAGDRGDLPNTVLQYATVEIFYQPHIQSTLSSVFRNLSCMHQNGTTIDYKTNEKFVLKNKMEWKHNMSKSPVEDSSGQLARNRRRILIVGKDGLFGGSVIQHCVPLAQRLQYDLVAVSVDTMFEGTAFEKRSSESAKKLIAEAFRSGIHCEHLVRTGDLMSGLEEVIHELKRIELVVVDSRENEEKIRDLPVPVASVFTNTNIKKRGDVSMPTGTEILKPKPIAKTLGYGVVSAVFYTALFMNADTAMRYFTKGGLYAALPIATVLLFSFVHGAFAHNLWSMMGIEALKKDRVRLTERKAVEKRKQLRRRPRLYAYVNPFHRINMD
jgi:hypothetical protein